MSEEASGTPVPRSSAASPRTEPKVPQGVDASYVVFDRKAGKVLVARRAHQVYRSASVVKILIALDQLRRAGGVPAADRASLQSMLRSSDDRAATDFWARGGQGKIIERMVPRLGLTETAPPPAAQPGFWGYTALSAADVVRTYRYLLEKAPKEHREFILAQLRRATPCGTDDFDQYFGIPRALPKPWAVKQGWSGFGDVPAVPCKARARGMGLRNVDLGIGRPVLHTSGLVDKEQRIMVVLTLHPAGSSFQRAAARVTTLTRQVHRAAG